MLVKFKVNQDSLNGIYVKSGYIFPVSSCSHAVNVCELSHSCKFVCLCSLLQFRCGERAICRMQSSGSTGLPWLGAHPAPKLLPNRTQPAERVFPVPLRQRLRPLSQIHVPQLLCGLGAVSYHNDNDNDASRFTMIIIKIIQAAQGKCNVMYDTGNRKTPDQQVTFSMRRSVSA